jgi:hypothetical protein
MSRINPLHLIIGLLAFVVTVNVAFLIVATRTADPIVSSYVTEER